MCWGDSSLTWIRWCNLTGWRLRGSPRVQQPPLGTHLVRSRVLLSITGASPLEGRRSLAAAGRWRRQGDIILRAQTGHL